MVIFTAKCEQIPRVLDGQQFASNRALQPSTASSSHAGAHTGFTLCIREYIYPSPASEWYRSRPTSSSSLHINIEYFY